jgi:hypothetical protein
MPSGELSVTLAASTLVSHAEPSGNIGYATLASASLASAGHVLLYGAANLSLDGVTSAAAGGVEIVGALAVMLGSARVENFSLTLGGTDSPYEDVISWTGHPLTGSLVRVRTGNLFGIFGEPNEFGLFAGEGWDASGCDPPSSSSQYIRLGSITNEFHNVPINLYDTGVLTMQMEPDTPSFAMGNPLPSAYGTGIGLWQGKDSDDVYKWRIGDPSAGGSMLNWDGSALSLVNSSLDISGENAHLAFGAPPPTSPTSGTGIWIDRNGFYGINDDITQIFIDTLDGVLYIDGGTEFGADPILGNLSIVGDLNMLGGTIQMGADNPKIIITDDSITGYGKVDTNIWSMLALDIRGYYGTGMVSNGKDWGFGIGDSSTEDDYMLYYHGMLTIKGSLTAGNNNVFIDSSGIIIVRDTTFTPLIRLGESKTDINFTISGSIGTNNVTGDIFAYGNDVGSPAADVETDLMLRSVSDLLAKSTLKASNETEGIVATVTAQTNASTSSVVINANEVVINGGKVQTASVAGGIPMADGTGKIDPSWLPTEEEPPVEAGEYLVPVGAAILWAGATVPDANWEFVTALDGYFIMGASATDLTTNYGAATHNHTNPTAITAGGHSNHVITVKTSSSENPAATTTLHQTYSNVYIVGTHTHAGTGAGESTAGEHTHTAATMTAEDNLPSYRRLRWIRLVGSTPLTAPVGSIVMQATGVTMGSDWSVCNGIGTYDMTDRFVYSGGTGGDITGGSNTHTHESGNNDEVSGHYHTIDVQTPIVDWTSTTDSSGTADAMDRHKHTATSVQSITGGEHYHTQGTSGSASSKPPHIVLQFWQRTAASSEDYFPVGTVMIWPNTSPTLPATWVNFTQAQGYIPKGPAYGEYIGSTFGTAYTGDAHYHSAGALSAAGAHQHGTDSSPASFTYSTAIKSKNNWAGGTPTTTMSTTHSHTGYFWLGAITDHTHGLSSANTSSTTALPPTKRIVYIIRESTGGTPQTYIKSVDTPTDHAVVRFNGTVGDDVQDSEVVIDDAGAIFTPTYISANNGLNSNVVIAADTTHGSIRLGKPSGTSGRTPLIDFYANGTAYVDARIIASSGSGSADYGGNLGLYGANIIANGALQDSGGHLYGLPVFLTTPLTSASWNGDSFSTTAKTKIDLSAVFGAPAGIKAIIANASIRDSGSAASTTAALVLAPDNGTYTGVYTYCAGLPNDVWTNHNMIVTCDSGGDIYYKITASGTSTMEIFLEITGYWL